MNEYSPVLLLESCLSALFVSREIDDVARIEAQELASQMQENAPDWLRVMGGVSVKSPKEAADEAAKWFCVWWLEENHPELLN